MNGDVVIKFAFRENSTVDVCWTYNTTNQVIKKEVS